MVDVIVGHRSGEGKSKIYPGEVFSIIFQVTMLVDHCPFFYLTVQNKRPTTRIHFYDRGFVYFDGDLLPLVHFF